MGTLLSVRIGQTSFATQSLKIHHFSLEDFVEYWNTALLLRQAMHALPYNQMICAALQNTTSTGYHDDNTFTMAATSSPSNRSPPRPAIKQEEWNQTSNPSGTVVTKALSSAALVLLTPPPTITSRTRPGARATISFSASWFAIADPGPPDVSTPWKPHDFRPWSASGMVQPRLPMMSSCLVFLASQEEESKVGTHRCWRRERGVEEGEGAQEGERETERDYLTKAR